MYRTPWFTLVEKEVNNSPSPYYVLKQPDCVSILALTEGGELLLVRQYRPALERESLELPSGHVEGNETPAEAAHRELIEETGYRANHLELMGNLITDTGRLGNRLWCFSATGLEPAAGSGAAENITLIKCRSEEILPKIEGGELEHSQDLAAIFLGLRLGKLNLGAGMGRWAGKIGEIDGE